MCNNSGPTTQETLRLINKDQQGYSRLWQVARQVQWAAGNRTCNVLKQVGRIRAVTLITRRCPSRPCKWPLRELQQTADCSLSSTATARFEAAPPTSPSVPARKELAVGLLSLRVRKLATVLARHIQAAWAVACFKRLALHRTGCGSMSDSPN
jgi:hypothetical protein